MKKILFSIIIPTYNREEKLKRALNSVINQTYKEWEIIIIDNNSKDGTKKMVKGFKDTKSGEITANLDVKFSERIYDQFTAHETGIFHYYTINKGGEQNDTYVHFESLWVKKNNKWIMMMEYQKTRTDETEWNTLLLTK